MSITRIQTTSQINTGFADSGDVFFPSVTLHSTLVIWIATNGAAVPTSGGVVDSAGDTWTQGIALTGGSGEGSIWYLSDASAGDHTVTVNPSGGSDLISAIGREYGGLATSSSLDGTPQSQTQSSTSSASTPSYTTSNAADLIVAICCAQNSFSSITFAEGGGFSLVGEWESGAGSGASFSGVDQIVSSAGSYQATWTLGASVNPTTCIMAFKASVATDQFALPNADVSAGSWTPSTGTDLFATVDEQTPDDSDYMTSASNPSSDTAVLALSSVFTPDTGTVTLRVRARTL